MRAWLYHLFPYVLGLTFLTHGQGLHSQTIKRPMLFTEQLFDNGRNQNVDTPSAATLWSKSLLDLNLPDFTPTQDSSYTSCAYGNALATLRSIRQQRTSTYAALWAQNQDRVFSACDSRAQHPLALQKPQGHGLPSRAQTDYQYQLGSWYFYQSQYNKALSVYQKLAQTRKAPQQAYAAYMAIRSLAYLHRFDDAYAMIDTVLQQPALKEVHAIARNYRFVIMSKSSNVVSYDERVSEELATKHLRWLHDLVHIDPEKTADVAQALADFRDAKEQLHSYFPLYDEATQSIDWWLSEHEQDAFADSPRMQAVKRLAPELKLIDWMQSSWAYNVFRTDWLWALHDAKNAYWEQNNHIVRHAWQRWQKEHDGAWLEIAITRVHPHDALAPDILTEAQKWLPSAWNARAVDNSTPEYRAWILTLWGESIRLQLGMGQTQQAIESIAKQPQVFTSVDTQRANFFGVVLDSKIYLENTLRWLVYVGDIPNARLALAAIEKSISPYSSMQGNFLYWESLLATDLAQTHRAGTDPKNSYGWQWPYGVRTDVWGAMVDSISTPALYELSLNTSISLPYRALMARAAFTRALLLGYTAEQVKTYASQAAKLNPEFREQILEGVSPHTPNAYITLMLKMPRLRPKPLLEYARNSDDRYTQRDNALQDNEIDKFNHNDNNWWCQFDQTSNKERIFQLAKVIPNSAKLFSLQTIENETKPFLDMQRQLLAQHPYQTLVDDDEVQLLEAIASAPQYLSQAVLAFEQTAPLATDDEELNARAANLHRAVRTTRYGCNRNGPHAEYSKAAFQLLHKRYKNTPWAAATPYWFQ